MSQREVVDREAEGHVEQLVIVPARTALNRAGDLAQRVSNMAATQCFSRLAETMTLDARQIETVHYYHIDY